MIDQIELDYIADAIHDSLYNDYMANAPQLNGLDPLSVTIRLHHNNAPEYMFRLEVWNSAVVTDNCFVVTKGGYYRNDPRIADRLYNELLFECHYQIERLITAGFTLWGDIRRLHTIPQQESHGEFAGLEQLINGSCAYRWTGATTCPATNQTDTDDEFTADVHTKANALLCSILNAAQLAEWQTHETITVIGQITGNIYTLSKKYNINITCYSADGVYIRKYCTTPLITRLPIEDQLVAQILMLTANENHFLNIATKWR